MDINYIDQTIKGWIITKSYSKISNGRKRTFLEVECENCHKIKEIRADKRNQVARCSCLNIKKEPHIKTYDFNKHLEEEWKKIEFFNIYSKNDLTSILKKNKDYKIYKINSRLPYSSDNIFVGTFEEYRRRQQELKIKREYKIKQELLAIKELRDNTEGIKCPYCGNISNYINACPHCKMKYNLNNDDSIHDSTNKKMIEYENETYTAMPGYFVMKEEGKSILYPLKDVVAKYIYQHEGISRIGLINIKKIDYCRQGVVGDFQGINSEGKNFIIDNVFQYNKLSPFIFINYKTTESEKIYNIAANDTIHYAVLVKKSNDEDFELAIYKNDMHLISVIDVVSIWGQSVGEVYYRKNNGKNYYIDLKTLEINETSLTERTTYLPGEKVLEYYKNKDEMEFYFNRGVFKNSVVLYEMLNSQYNIIPVENEFFDDDVMNYKVEISLNDYNIQNIISIIINRKSDALTSFGYSYNVYGFPLFRILRDVIKQNKSDVLKLIDYESKDLIEYIIDISSFSYNNTNNYKEIFNKLKQKYNCNDVQLIDLMIKKYGIEQVFNLDYYYFKNREGRAAKNFYNKIIDDYYNSLPESKILWKSEYKLFMLVKHTYPDAIYQYYDPKFKGLIIDIYIPSLKVAIEYQGEQHYRVIERFSDNSLSERIENDNLKRQLCRINNIKLIEWKYDELISKLILDKKIKEIKKD